MHNCPGVSSYSNVQTILNLNFNADIFGGPIVNKR